MEILINLVRKQRTVIAYVFCGVLTTAINIVSYGTACNVLGISNVISTCLAWVLSVLFAYVTNKIWVFDSKTIQLSVILPELASFFGARAFTGLLDLAIMYIGVDVLRGNNMLIKVGSNVIVVILNYILSKMVVFRKKVQK